jgi:radical SAM superfamily enzyme YgiQ (UPF0313 family)
VRDCNTKVIIVQLPPPRFSFRSSATNIPLAAGFLARTLEKTCPQIEVGILESEVADVYADAGLAQRIIEKAPDILAMSLYVWNVERSLFIASNVRRSLPNICVVIGGPEVTKDNTWVLAHPAPSAGLFGEGEARVCDLVNSVRDPKSRWDIPSSFCRTASGLKINEDYPPVNNLEFLDYPYLDGKLKASLDGTVFLETLRGCPYQCRYCYYHKAFQNIRYHPPATIEKLLDMFYAGDSPVSEIYLMDPTFNSAKNFREILRMIATRRTKKDIRLHTELRADFLTEKDVRLFVEAGLKSAEIGLQSSNPVALETAGRKMNLEKLTKGAHMLKEAGIEVTTGIILGLPGDTPKGFESTLRWLKDSEAYSVAHPFVLSILPGTDFRLRALELQLEYQQRPPYYVRSIPTFAPEELRTSMELCEETLQMEIDYIPPPSLVDSGEACVASPEAADYVSKWIVNPGSNWRSLLPEVLSKATNPFTIWFYGAFKEPLILELADEFVMRNPHSILNVVFDFGKPLPTSFLNRFIELVGNPDLYINRAYFPLYDEGEIMSVNTIMILPDPGSQRLRTGLLDKYEESAQIVWETSVTDDERLTAIPAPLLISGAWTEDSHRSTRVMDLLWSIHSARPEEALFRNQSAAAKWETDYCRQDLGKQFPERILRT